MLPLNTTTDKAFAFVVSSATPRSSVYPDLTGPVLTSLSQVAAPDSAVPYTSLQSDLHPLTTRQPLQIDGTPVCVLCFLATLNQPQTVHGCLLF